MWGWLSWCGMKLEILRKLSGVGIWAGAVWAIIRLETDSLWFEIASNSAMNGDRFIKKEVVDCLVIVGWIVTALLLHRMVNRVFLKAAEKKSRSTYRDDFKID